MSCLPGFQELYPEMIRVVLSGHSDVKLILNLVNRGGNIQVFDQAMGDGGCQVNHQAVGVELFDLRKEVVELRKKLDDAGLLAG